RTELSDQELEWWTKVHTQASTSPVLNKLSKAKKNADKQTNDYTPSTNLSPQWAAAPAKASADKVLP
ncbi:MAG: hypothetical protein IKZ87_01790, partial [Actinomycetaceae bacterium]|nr:hypothetical protein [Actinomycetaceae bacterium]